MAHHLGRKWMLDGASPKAKNGHRMVRHLGEKETVDGVSPRQEMDVVWHIT